ncbi:MAG: patatin family protein [Synechococcaceae cyanobacterium SM2_3_1]|nr:patatin family protein [Synechococcaceae cyanobacterium SM2_3_1]
MSDCYIDLIYRSVEAGLKSVGLVLGSGGARGWAHIGVIRALEEANIQISHITGASIGALVGAVYAAGELDDLEEFIRSLDWKGVVSFFDVVFPSSGLLDGNRVYELLSEHLHSMNIEDADLEFCCVATDLITGQEVRLQAGPMVDAVRASISIPGIFTPFERDGRFLGDGGIINPLPVDIMQQMGAEVIIAVNLNHHSSMESITETVQESLSLSIEAPEMSSGQQQVISSHQETNIEALAEAEISRTLCKENTDSEDKVQHKESTQKTSVLIQGETTNRVNIKSLIDRIQQRYELIQDQVQAKLENWMPEKKTGMNIFDVIGASLNVMEQQVTQSKLDTCPPDILIQPMLSQYGIFDFHLADDIIHEGYRSMKDLIPELKEKLSTKP